MDNGCVSIDHYENFPVASRLCPRALRPAVVAIYRFARTADDLADEGTAGAEERLGDLAAYRADLLRSAAAPCRRRAGPRSSSRCGRRSKAMRCLPDCLPTLLSAFEQDVVNPSYDDRAELLDYCRRSAAPVGRLLLTLYGVGDELSLAAFRLPSARAAARQLLAGPRQRPAPRTHLHTGDVLPQTRRRAGDPARRRRPPQIQRCWPTSSPGRA
jgi:phytoene/squalene synthetase